MRRRAPRAFLLADLGFGDAGKGLLTDYLVRRTGAGLVVRYNGGAQAGHNVVTPEGRHHTFSQFGAGSFVPGVRTSLSRHVVVHPTGLLREGEILRGKGLGDIFGQIAVDERARVITPYHQAAGRLRELSRGPRPHGTCGVGVGEAVGHALGHPEEAVLAGDLRDQRLLARKAGRVRERLREEVRDLFGALPDTGEAALERAVFEADDLLGTWVEEAAQVGRRGLVKPPETLAAWMREAGTAVFEGAQGVLLDERAGFHPYTTWSRCTFENALELIKETVPSAEIRRIGVLRSYGVRHGPGPLPTEASEIAAAVWEHNGAGGWQGPVRYGWFDAVLARYALDAIGPLDALALTHLDLPERLGAWRLCERYGFPGGRAPSELVARFDPDGAVTRLRPPEGEDLARQARLTALLAEARPSYSRCDADGEAVFQETQSLLETSIGLVARGPTCGDVSLILPGLLL